MGIETKLRNSIKLFASEAGRFKLQDLANILGVEISKVKEELNNLVSMGEIEGTLANKDAEFVTKTKLKQEVMNILENPSLIEPFNYVRNKKDSSEHGKNVVLSALTPMKMCSSCNIPVKGAFCPKCGKKI
jgi:hypothetical protein